MSYKLRLTKTLLPGLVLVLVRETIPLRVIPLISRLIVNIT